MPNIAQLAVTPRARTAVPGLDPEPYWDDESRWEWIAENAYYRAERRGFLPGFEVADWLEAERELELSEHTGKMAEA
ncbi:MAG: DUF2934 domain-containing protein [Steroidobacteraceae bacterium]